jgi:hypothetical protein
LISIGTESSALSFQGIFGCLRSNLVELKERGEAEDAKTIDSLRSSPIDLETLTRSVQPIWDDPNTPFESKVVATFKAYVEQRISALPLDKQQVAREALAQVEIAKITNALTTYHPKIIIGDKLAEELIAKYYLIAHELEHVGQFGKVPKWKDQRRFWQSVAGVEMTMPTTPAMSFLQTEYEALGAQWDFLQAIPLEERNQAADRISASDLPEHSKMLLKNDVKMANLSRKEYITAVRADHGYTSYQRGEHQRRQQHFILFALVVVPFILELNHNRTEKCKALRKEGKSCKPVIDLGSLYRHEMKPE